MKHFDIDQLVDILSEMLEIRWLSIANNFANFYAIECGIRIEETVAEKGYTSRLFSSII